MLKILGVFIPLIAAATPALSGEWEIVARSDNLALGVDRLSIRSSGSNRTYWRVIVYRVMQDGIDYRLTRNRVNCDNWTISGISTVSYSINNSTPIDSSELSGRSAVIVPDSLGEAEADYVCQDQFESTTSWAVSAEEFAIDRRTSPGEFDAAWREQRPPDLSIVFGS